MTGIMQHDINVVRRLTAHMARNDVFPGMFVNTPLPKRWGDWRDRVPESIREAWWELDERTRLLIAMLLGAEE